MGNNFFGSKKNSKSEKKGKKSVNIKACYIKYL